MKPLIVLTVIVLLYSCKTERKQSNQNKHQATDTRLNFNQVIKQHLQYIDSVHKLNPDLIEVENSKLQQTLNSFKQDIFNTKDTLDFESLYIVKSFDKQFCLVSWDTRMGGTMIEYATMAFYRKTSGELRTKILRGDTIYASMENTLMHYDTIYTVRNNGRTFYLAHGYGQGSTALPWQEIRAFEIEKNQLVNPNVFPENKPYIFVEFDTHQFGEDERIPAIKVKENAKTILIPLATDKEGFSGKYQSLTFNGQAYKHVD